MTAFADSLVSGLKGKLTWSFKGILVEPTLNKLAETNQRSPNPWAFGFNHKLYCLMKVANFLNELEVLGFPMGTYPMDFNTMGNIMVELQIGHDNVAVVQLDEDEDEFTLALNGSIALTTSVMDNVVTQLDNYIADFGY